MRVIEVGDKFQNVRADFLLAETYPDFSRSSLQKLFDDNLVKLGGKPVKQGYKLKASDKLEVDDGILSQKPPLLDLPIIYEDDNAIVIDKPAGILTHSKGGFNNEPTVASFIEPRIDAPLRGGNRGGIVHRLDRATSGLIICAKNEATKKMLQKQFSERRVKKTYTALVEGIPSPPEAIIDAPIERNFKKPQTFKVGASGKTATTAYRTEKILNKLSKSVSRLYLQPTTGRTHQLRVHLAYVGHPIVGDKVYGTSGEHMYLHATSLELTLPGGVRRVFKSQLPKYFNNYESHK